MKYFLIILSLSTVVRAQIEEPLWEYGLGIGYIQFPQYPASDQVTSRIIPFPTFQYRGRRVRADDREGTKAYLLKSSIWSLQLSAGGFPAAEADDNEARQGMKDLPWMLFVGPQLAVRLTDAIDFRVAVFQSVSTDFNYTAWAGNVYEAKIQYRRQKESFLFRAEKPVKFSGLLSFELRSADEKFLSTYYEVSPQDVTPARVLYSARSGQLNSEIVYFESIKVDRITFYAGISYADFGSSANRQSPLHKSNSNISLLTGITYQLGESEDEAPEEPGDSILNKIKN